MVVLFNTPRLNNADENLNDRYIRILDERFANVELTGSVNRRRLNSAAGPSALSFHWLFAYCKTRINDPWCLSSSASQRRKSFLSPKQLLNNESSALLLFQPIKRDFKILFSEIMTLVLLFGKDYMLTIKLLFIVSSLPLKAFVFQLTMFQ